MTSFDYTLYDGTLDGKLDPYELLGCVIIAGSDGEIRAEDVYVDDWFCSLVRASSHLEAGDVAFSVGIESEPRPIDFERSVNTILMSYGGMQVRLDGMISFERALLVAIQKLLTELREKRPDAVGDGHAELQSFLKARQ